MEYTNGSVIETTREHPFYVSGAGWTPAQELHSGMLLTQASTSPSAVNLDLVSQRHSDQPAVIKSVTVVQRSETVYNFEVAEAHTYYVGIEEVLVHNKCFLEGTEAEKAEFMAMLQKISSDDLVVDPETGEVTIVSKGDGTDRPLGTKMLRNLIGDEDFEVTIEKREVTDSGTSKFREYGPLGALFGLGTSVYYNPDDETDAFPTKNADGDIYFAAMKPHEILMHELGHAEMYRQGKQRLRSETDDSEVYYYNPETREFEMMKIDDFPWNETQQTGISKYMDWEFNERDLSKEQGEDWRVNYETEGRKCGGYVRCQ